MSELGSDVMPLADAGQRWGHDGAWTAPADLPMIANDEVADLSAHFGAPLRRTFHVQADDYMYAYRFNRTADRRAEVVFAIEDAAGKVWVHAKPHYPAHIYRLPTGGVHWHELVIDGLLREVKEETGIKVEIARFLGIIDYHFWYGSLTTSFASYIFHLRAACVGCPPIPNGEPISEFRAVQPTQIRQLANNLRHLPAGRRAWGEWRALAHDLVSDTLSN